MTLDGIDEATLNKILTLIELQFGSKCEVVLHDLTKPYDHTIVDIRNGYITGRKVGDCGSNLGLEVMRGTVKNGDRYNYITHTRDGKILRSSSIYFYDENGTATAALCLNLDITETIKFESFSLTITSTSLPVQIHPPMRYLLQTFLNCWSTSFQMQRFW